MEPAATVTGWTRALPARGTARLRTALRDGRDRLIASDPGLGRLRQGLRAVLAVGTTVLVEQLYAQALGAPPILALLMGAIVAMLASTSVSEPSRRATLLTMGGVPVVASVGAGLGVVTSAHHLLGLTTFVVVSFVAVWVRRFGPRWFTYGFLAWQGFFFALFLHPPLKALPYLVGSILVASLWVGVLLLTFFWGDPQVRLRRTVQALRARARAGISVMIEVLDDPEAVKPRQRLRGQMVQLSEIALLMDGQLADSRALPPGLRPGQVRRWAVDIEIAMDDAAGAVVELARLKQRHELPAQVDADVRQLLHALGWGEGPRAHEWVTALNRAPGPTIPAVRRLAWAAAELLLLVERWETGDLEDHARPGQADDPLDLAEVPFEPVVTLFGGNLPGSAMAASNVGGDTVGRSRWSPSRWALTTRQAFQAAVAAALAIVAGESISSQRYYWAVIAAFIAFTGRLQRRRDRAAEHRARGRDAGGPGRCDRPGPPDRRTPGRDRRRAVLVHLPGLLPPAALVCRDDLLHHPDARADVHVAEHVHRCRARAAARGDGRGCGHRCGGLVPRPPDRDPRDRAGCACRVPATSWPTCSTAAQPAFAARLPAAPTPTSWPSAWVWTPGVVRSCAPSAR